MNEAPKHIASYSMQENSYALVQKPFPMYHQFYNITIMELHFFSIRYSIAKYFFTPSIFMIGAITFQAHNTICMETLSLLPYRVKRFSLSCIGPSTKIHKNNGSLISHLYI